MAKKPSVNVGYLRAIQLARKKSGLNWGAASWLAGEIGAQRQLLHYWAKSGFPPEYVKKAAKVLDVQPSYLNTLTIRMPETLWDDIRNGIRSDLSQATIVTTTRRK